MSRFWFVIGCTGILWLGDLLLLTGLHPTLVQYQICILKSREGELYDQAFQGLREELASQGYRENENLRFTFFVLKGNSEDSKVPAAIFKQNPDYIVAIGTDAAVFLKESIPTLNSKNTKPVPVIFLMVLDPVALGIVRSLERSGLEYVGVSLMAPPNRQMRLIKDILPKAQAIGVLYNPSDVTSHRLIETAKEEAAKLGLTLESVPVNRVEDVPSVLQRLEGKVQAVWIIPDVVCAGPESFKTILNFSDRNRIPVFGFASTFVKRGALAALGVDFTEQGTLAAEVLVKLIDGAQPQEMEVRVPKRLRSSYNLKKAKELNVQLPDSLLNLADEVFD